MAEVGDDAAGFDLEFGDAVPDFALVGHWGAAGFQGAWTERVFLERALVGHDVAGFAERLGGVGPAALLGATDGDLGLGDFFDQDGGVEDAVLLGAGEFLAVDEEDGFVGAVDDHQVGTEPAAETSVMAMSQVARASPRVRYWNVPSAGAMRGRMVMFL